MNENLVHKLRSVGEPGHYRNVTLAAADEIERLEHQRDAMLEALKVTQELHGHSIALSQDRQDRFDAADKLVTAAIALTEGGAL